MTHLSYRKKEKDTRSALEKKIDNFIVLPDAESFYDGGKMNLFLERWECKEVGAVIPIISLPTQKEGAQDKYSWFGYTLDPMADPLEVMANRIILF